MAVSNPAQFQGWAGMPGAGQAPQGCVPLPWGNSSYLGSQTTLPPASQPNSFFDNCFHSSCPRGVWLIQESYLLTVTHLLKPRAVWLLNKRVAVPAVGTGKPLRWLPGTRDSRRPAGWACRGAPPGHGGNHPWACHMPLPARAHLPLSLWSALHSSFCIPPIPCLQPELLGVCTRRSSACLPGMPEHPGWSWRVQAPQIFGPWLPPW